MEMCLVRDGNDGMASQASKARSEGTAQSKLYAAGPDALAHATIDAERAQKFFRKSKRWMAAMNTVGVHGNQLDDDLLEAAGGSELEMAAWEEGAVVSSNELAVDDSADDLFGSTEVEIVAAAAAEDISPAFHSSGKSFAGACFGLTID